jgi:hypothetical protein
VRRKLETDENERRAEDREGGRRRRGQDDIGRRREEDKFIVYITFMQKTSRLTP